MTLEDKLKPERLYDDSLSLMLFLPLTALSLMAISMYFAINTKKYEVLINDILYSVEAVKNRDTEIYVYDIIKEKQIETLKQMGAQVLDYPEEYKFKKTCRIIKSKKQFMPLIKGGYYRILESRPEEYILPTEKELLDCYNPSIKIPHKSPF